jgi:uncharacterized protein (DUF2249 family)
LRARCHRAERVARCSERTAPLRRPQPGTLIAQPYRSEFDCTRCVPGECGSDLLRRFDALRPLQAFVLAATEDPAPLLARLQVERPGLFEWSPLQEGPPAWRIEIARRQSRPGEARAITEALEWDHDRLDRLERMAFDAWAAGDLREAEGAFVLFAHGLRRHIGFEEEEVLYPVTDSVLTRTQRDDLMCCVQRFQSE